MEVVLNKGIGTMSDESCNIQEIKQQNTGSKM
jgi:hypothetical protein